MGASVWRVGRTAEDRLMYGNRKIRQGSNVRKRISETERFTSTLKLSKKSSILQSTKIK